MPAWSKVLGNRSICGEKSLRVPWGLKPLHPPLALPGGLMGVFRAVIEIPMLTVLDSRRNLALGGPVVLRLSVMITRGTEVKPLSSLRKNFVAAFLLRRRCPRISSTFPS
jgi:hypothetical protein